MAYEDDGPLATIADAANEYHLQGLQCPFDCWRCQPVEYDVAGEWLLTFADGCVGDALRYAEGHGAEAPLGGYCTHGWQPVTKAVEFLGLPYYLPRPPVVPVDPWAVQGVEPPF